MYCTARTRLLSLLLFFACGLAGQSPDIDSLRSTLAQTPDDSLRVVLLNKIGWALRNYDLDSAMAVLGQSERLAVQYDLPINIAHARGNLGTLWYVKGDYEKAMTLASEALEVFRKYDQENFAVMMRNTLALIYRKQGEFKKAYAQFDTALHYFESVGDSQRVSFMLNNIGGLYSEQGESSKALDYYYRSAQIKEALGDYGNAISTYSNIGDLQRTNENLESAQFFIEKALALSRTHQIKHSEGIVLNSYGILKSAQGDTMAALAIFDEARKVNETQGNLDGLSTSLLRIGEIYAEQGSYELAEDHLTKALAIAEKQNKNIILSSIYAALGRTYDGLKQTSAAIQAYENTLRLEKEYPNIEIRHIAYNRLAELYARTGDYEHAYEARNHAYADLDTLQGAERIRHIAELETQYQTRHKEALLAEQELTIARQNNQRKNLLLASLIGFVLLGGTLLYLRYLAVRRRDRALAELRVTEMEREQLKEVDRLKSAFLANITHEFRTPLTLILGPLRQMLDGTLAGEPKKYLRTMEHHAERLLLLVNQLLDAAKAESSRLTIQVQEDDLARVIREITYAFESKAAVGEFELRVDAPQPVMGFFDREALSKILTNLISNACRFTPAGGHIDVTLSSENGVATIQVSDTGPGIPEEELPHIFDRFFQGAAGRGEMSSGIGLSLSRELAELHHGSLTVESSHEGAVFLLQIPLTASSYAEKEMLIVQPQIDSISQTPGDSTPEDDGRSCVLVVEDNTDVRQYIREQLEETFVIYEASDGQAGLEAAIRLVPDLVITDIMMPVMDGIELARELRSDLRTSHIPLIMLTARSEEEDKLAGLEAGGEVYLTKPFNPQELRLRVREMIRLREHLRQQYQNSVLFAPEDAQLSSQDNTFLKAAREHVLSNLSDESFSVVDLSEALHMSRATLHRKLKNLTGYGPNEMIRSIRLEQARELLKGEVNVSEVAFAVGFGSLAYFSKCYKDKFGHVPSEARVQHRTS